LKDFEENKVTGTICMNCRSSFVQNGSTVILECDVCGDNLPKKRMHYIHEDPDTLVTSDTYEELLNVGKILLEIIDKYQYFEYIYALIRPPGHHASENHHSGFCIINNAYIVAKELTLKNEKVLIFDWDLHHGDGTEKLVKQNSDKNIMYVSIHYYSPSFFPGTGNGEYVSDNIFNFPVNNYGFMKFTTFFDTVVKLTLKDLIEKCSVILISNGLDSHVDDPMGKLKLVDDDYVYMTEYFKSSGKKMIYLLEGGYNPKVIRNVSEKIIKTLQNR
jgi:acetoin utilization deacetylase AcuC-like enzyme